MFVFKTIPTPHGVVFFIWFTIKLQNQILKFALH